MNPHPLRANAFEIETLPPSDLVGTAECAVLDADSFPYASIPFGMSPGLRTWVARTGSPSHVRGFLVATARRPSYYIHGLAVAASFRRGGLGRALLLACVAHARTSRARSLVLHVGVGNDAATLLYRSTGFERESKQLDFYAPGVYPVRDAYEMVLKLR